MHSSRVQHPLIKTMPKCLRKAISNDGGPIYNLQFVLLYCLMPVFVLNDCLFFPFFAISSKFNFYHLNSYFITNNNRKNF